uniref:Protein lin-9 homolog isoform X3 n=2 Tax=Petromyzon marinus TaxID=7757 RepID=A0AAJ7XCW4_PETMA|nr:protein lin-9 homolog isoform X3 [Petromyzon marinus]
MSGRVSTPPSPNLKLRPTNQSLRRSRASRLSPSISVHFRRRLPEFRALFEKERCVRSNMAAAAAEHLLDESSSAEALVSLKEGGLSSPWSRRTPPRKGAAQRDSKLSAGLTTPDKRSAQKVGIRLRNLLKLPKAHKWCIYEWFYSNIDKPLFEGDNDFCVCLKESFPQLRTRRLSRVEWGKVRRLMGKPRRCSEAFFAEERTALLQKRHKIRQLQQQKVTDLSSFKELPEEIPLPLVIGTKVTARLRGQHDGLFTGQIDAVDTIKATYRVTFDRPGLGTHTIPDIEVVSNEPQDSMPISSFAQKQRPVKTFNSPPRVHYSSMVLASPLADPLLGQVEWKSRLGAPGPDSNILGGFPINFLVQVTRLSKILMTKKDYIKQLKEMNTEGEKLRSYSEPFGIDFQKRYATIVLGLENLNKDLNHILLNVQQYCYQLAPQQGLQPMDQPTEMRRQCLEEAQEMVRDVGRSGVGRGGATSAITTGGGGAGERVASGDDTEGLRELVARLSALLLQIKRLAESDLNSFEFKSLTDSLDEIRSSLDPTNISCFQNNVEIHVAHIQSGLSQMGNLHAFASNLTEAEWERP